MPTSRRLPRLRPPRRRPAEPPAPATAPAATKTAPVVTTLRDRMAAVLDKQMAAADKLLKSSDDEMAKPEKERDLRKAHGLKLGAAQAYLKVSQAAKNDATQLKKDDQPGFLDQYEKANREKAISLYLDLAGKAKELKDYARRRQPVPGRPGDRSPERLRPGRPQGHRRGVEDRLAEPHQLRLFHRRQQPGQPEYQAVADLEKRLHRLRLLAHLGRLRLVTL